VKTVGTGGSVTYTTENCDCGLTGGCKKCRPVHISWYRRVPTSLGLRKENFVKPLIKGEND